MLCLVCCHPRQARQAAPPCLPCLFTLRPACLAAAPLLSPPCKLPNISTSACVAAPCLPPPALQVGIRQGFLGGLVVGVTNCVAFFAYALALWYGSTRVEAGAYTGGSRQQGRSREGAGQGRAGAQLPHLAG
jgi:hypothetical protein